MRIWTNKHFGFSKGEFNGLLFLIFIIIVLKALPFLYNPIIPAEKDDPELLAKIDEIAISDDQHDHYIADRADKGTIKKTLAFHYFDPNTLDVDGWQSFGLSIKQAQAIVNYTNKGGKFYKVEDLQKMYTISAQMYERLAPYVKIENAATFNKKGFVYEKKEYVKKAPVMVDVNTADSAQLDEIKGIGGTFANRILKYRERLGGFYKKEQLMEVYGLDSVKYHEIESQISFSKIPLKQININTAQFNDLKVNPYLSYKQINAIIQYRKQHGNYTSAADLKKIAILNQEIIDKIAPYLSF